MSSSAILTLVRHGETPANLQGVWAGSTDSPLTDAGHAQAHSAAAFLAGHCPDASVLYASPLSRTRDTARPIAERLGLEVRIEQDLREFDLGTWEGKSYRELHETHALWENIGRDPDFAPHGGESPRQVRERIAACLRGLAERHAGERVIAVSHGGALHLGLALLFEPKVPEMLRPMSNCGVTDLVLDPSPRFLSFDLCDHVDGGHGDPRPKGQR